MDIVSKGQCHPIGNDEIRQLDNALNRIVESAQSSVASEGFWRNYVRLERVYNAVEVKICLIVSKRWKIMDFFKFTDIMFVCAGRLHYSCHNKEQQRVKKKKEKKRRNG